jgi:hypothetical protein
MVSRHAWGKGVSDAVLRAVAEGVVRLPNQVTDVT